MTIVDRSARTAVDVLRAVQQLTPTIAARAAEIEAARRVPPDLLDDLVRAGCFRMLLPPTHGGVAADLATAMRVLETLATRRCLRGLDRWHRRRELARPGRPSPGELRPHRGHHARGHHRRRVPAGRHGDTCRRRLPRIGPVELRQRLRARHLDLRQLHREPVASTACRPDAHRRVLPGRGHDRGHLARLGPSRNWQPPLPRRRPSYRSTAPSVPVLESRPSTSPSSASRSRLCSRLLSPPWPSASPRGRSTTSSLSPRARCRCWPGPACHQPTVPARARHGRDRTTSRPRPADEVAEATWARRRRGRADHRSTAAHLTGGERLGNVPGGRHRRHGLPQRWRHLALRRLPAPAPASRRARPHPALPRQGRHARDGRRGPRGPGDHGPGLLRPLPHFGAILLLRAP